MSSHELIVSRFVKLIYVVYLPLFAGNADFTTPNAFSMLSVLVTSSCITFSLFEQEVLSSSPPFSVKQPANTENPMESSLLANMFPNPVSHPVIITWRPP